MVNFLTFLWRSAQIRQCNSFFCIDVLQVYTDIFHAIVFMFQITITIGILVVVLIESFHVSLEFPSQTF